MHYNETPTKGKQMQHTYSFLGSPLHLILEDKIAEGYNRHVDAFLEAQKLFKLEHDRNWTVDEPLSIHLAQEDHDAYDKVAQLINFLIEINGGAIDISEDQCTSDRFVLV